MKRKIRLEIDFQSETVANDLANICGDLATSGRICMNWVVGDFTIIDKNHKKTQNNV